MTEVDIKNQIKKRWDSIAKPLDSMGFFESAVIQLGAIQKTLFPSLKKACLTVLCADNGIVEEGVSQSGQEVTAICAKNIAAKKSAAGVMAENLGAEVRVYDFGIASKEKIEGVTDCKVRRGTRNFLKEPSMTENEFKKAMEGGMNIAAQCKKDGFDVICIGEMGIGNTSTSAALAAALLKKKAEEVTGRGAGLCDSSLKRKIQVVQKAIEKYDLYNASVEKAVCSVGGFDIAGMIGLYRGAKKYGIPVILDGVICVVAALSAEELEEGCRDFLIPSHKSREPSAALVFSKLKTEIPPVIDAAMALGEGSGAVMMLGLLRNALCVYDSCLRFENSGVEQYERFKK